MFSYRDLPKCISSRPILALRISGELACTGPNPQPVLPTQPSVPMNLMLGFPGLQVITTPLA